MKPSVCIDAVFNGKDFYESLEAITTIGLDTFEFWCWWEKDLHKIKDIMDRESLVLSTMCTKFISLVDENCLDDYIEGLKDSIEAAKFLGCKTLITQVGNDTGAPRSHQLKQLINGLKTCVPLLDSAGITLLVEPLNTLVDHQGYFLSKSPEGFDIIKAVDSPQVRLLFDIYHQQIMEGHLIHHIKENIDLIGHFHAAGNPGRHELNIGEINYTEIFKMIDTLDYTGYVGLEYFPVKDPLSGLMKYLNK